MSGRVVRYPTHKRRRMSNGVTWVRWGDGPGWWTQDLTVAQANDRPPQWPMRPSVRLWSSPRRRFALLLPMRAAQEPRS